VGTTVGKKMTADFIWGRIQKGGGGGGGGERQKSATPIQDAGELPVRDRRQRTSPPEYHESTLLWRRGPGRLQQKKFQQV